ncbi:DNA-directed DNA polymerase [Tanacetum coccineum]|uniref:DNA-directed DNA polymerase n=1 Tax=Tanacetum coccineum TaxID=301880 RepID=A0ABQ5CVA0_9ASTR
MEFDRWRNKNLKNERHAPVKIKDGMDDEGEVTLYLTRRSLEVLRKFHWMILGGRFTSTSIEHWGQCRKAYLLEDKQIPSVGVFDEDIDDPDISMEEYIQLMADKARGCGQTFNWETTMYGNVYCDDIDSFTDFETDFPTIIYNDASTSNQNVSSEPTDATTAYPWVCDTALLTTYLAVRNRSIGDGYSGKIRHFKTLSLDESRSPDFDLFSDQEEYSEEEVAETMAETMEQYMSKTRVDYGSGIARPKIEDKDSFELKCQFLKELRTNTFSGSDHEDANEHIEKVLEIVDLFHTPNITIDQVMLRAFHMSLTGAASRWLRNKPSGSITTWEDLKIKFLSKYCPPALLFYNGLDVPTGKILDSRGAIPSKTAADAKVSIQKIAEYSQKWYNRTSKTRSTETSDGLATIQAQLNNLGREIKKVNEKVYAAQVGCEQCKGTYYTKDCPLKEERKTLEEAYYTQFGAPFQGGGYKVIALGFHQRNNVNPSYQERRQSMEETLSKFMSESTKIHEENSNLIKEIRASTDAAIRNQGASIKTLEIQIGQISKVLQERGFGCLPSSTETNPRDHVKSISTIVEADSYLIRQKKGSYGPQFSEAYSKASHINNSIPKKEKDLGSFTLPCFINNVCFDNALADLGASVSVMPLSTYLNLGLGELAHTKLTVELANKTVKYPKGIAENMLVGIGKFVFPIDFIILDMPEDIKVPLILGRPFLSTAHAKIDVFKRKITLRVGEEKIIFKSVKPARSLIKRVYMLSLRERMKLDLEARLMGETLVLNRSLYPFFEDYIELNDLNVPLELRRDQVDDLIPTNEEGKVVEEFRARNDARMDKLEYKGNNVVGTLMNIPIFVETFSILTDFAVLEDMDAYHDEGMGDVIFGEPFLREVRINAKQFEGMITIHNGNEEVTYHMAQSHPRFKHHTNEQCNKIPPLLKVSEEDKMNEISYSHQKLKGFYKGVLNLGPEYVRDAKMEEWLTRGHISVHEME